MSTKKGVLLVNLGTPDSPLPRDVYRYLIEFLTDERVVDYPWLKRQLIVRGFIVPLRYKQSAKAYQAIWTEEGSPLMVYGIKVKNGLQNLLGDDYVVELAMRYQNPSIEKGLTTFLRNDIHDILVVPLFPQYASATTGSVHQKVMDTLSKAQIIPRLTLVQQFAIHPALIDAFCTIAQTYSLKEYDHYVFSFHGLPQRYLQKADLHNRCLRSSNCCKENTHCYAAQCKATAEAMMQKLHLPLGKTSLCFQSRLGKEPWMQPYTSDVIQNLAKQGHKKVLVFSPSFVCDCLETLYEISEEYAAEFKHAGGEKLDLVHGLNDHPKWLEALKEIVLDNIRT